MNQAKRCWINQPSTAQPLHSMHGTCVLALDYTAKSSLVYFLSGDVVSAVVLKLSLSDGWPKHLQSC